jgi:hypothetical protein
MASPSPTPILRHREGDSSLFDEDGPCFLYALEDLPLQGYPTVLDVPPAAHLPAGTAAAVLAQTDDPLFAIDGGEPDGIELGNLRYLWFHPSPATSASFELHGRCEAPLLLDYGHVVDPHQRGYEEHECYSVAQKDFEGLNGVQFLEDGWERYGGYGTFPVLEGDTFYVWGAGSEEGTRPRMSPTQRMNDGMPLDNLVFIGDCAYIESWGIAISKADLSQVPVQPLSPEAARLSSAVCTVVAEAPTAARTAADELAPPRRQVAAGDRLWVTGRTRDGWYAVNVGDEAEFLGLFRNAWLAPSEALREEGPCDGVPTIESPPSSDVCYFVTEGKLYEYHGASYLDIFDSTGEPYMVPVVGVSEDGWLLVGNEEPPGPSVARPADDPWQDSWLYAFILPESGVLPVSPELGERTPKQITSGGLFGPCADLPIVDLWW